ncbi:MAG TPA: hypothetical protein PLL57_16535 [Flavobacteriales bacterium]|nr:hypothetical protein [Flavobacteriales bacterium]
MNRSLLVLAITCTLAAHAQPDTLWIPTRGETTPYAVVYEPVRVDAQYQRVGRFTVDTARIAVTMDYKRGHASGIYRAYYPDGRPLIFAVYGWDSPHGDWTEYDELGGITLKGQYRRGLRDGTWAFRKDGIVGHYKEGLKHGKWKYYEQGRITRTERYRKDELVRTRTFN